MAGLVCGWMLLAGCATGGETDQAAGVGPHDAAAEVRSELMEVEPERGTPGEILAVYFPEETERGVAFVLEEETASGWALRYFLVAGDEASGADWWTPADAEGRGWDDVGIGGGGPDFVEVPDTAEPGSYRLCTANAGQNFCAPVDVVE
jgi:hypothetical protein